MTQDEDRWAELLSRGAMAAAGELGSTTIGLKAGTRIGPYEVVSLLGAGGMGEVYRARDPRLGRDVAVKILPRAFTADADRLARFEREARVLASLNHPHIATIHGIEDADGLRAIVMELVDGDTLADRISRTAGKGLAVKAALDIARQIADALDAAHEKGIVHRDLKPANITITPLGVVKVLDFGLAKVDVGERTGEAPTITVGHTREGSIVGTVAYMSPEQARGQAIDRRTDIWAFGCVLYEMLAARPAFAGATASDTTAAILEREPDWTALPGALSPRVTQLLARCLAKDARRRIRDIGDAQIDLEDSSSAHEPLTAARNRALHPATLMLAVAAAVVAIFAAFAAAWYLKPAGVGAPSPIARLTLPAPPNVMIPLGGQGRVAVSPDGTYVAFVGGAAGRSQLYLRALQNGDARAIADTAGAEQPFFSPDSRWLAFFHQGKLKKVMVSGGVPVVIADAASSRSGFWADNDTIVFAPQARGSGIVQVSADGGTAKEISTLDAGRGETSHRFPVLLPGGQNLLFAAYGATYDDVAIIAQSLTTGRRRVLIEHAGEPVYASSGHLLYVQPQRPGTILAVPFDATTATLTGAPVPAAEGVLTDRGDYAEWGVSQSGLLVYAPGGFKEAENALVLVDRKGTATPFGALPRRPYQHPRFSPDGSHVVVVVNGIQSSVWIYDRSNGSLNRLTFAGNNAWAIWSPDGKRITYASNRAEPWRLYWRPSDGSGIEEKLLTIGKGDQQPYGWSPDGKLLFYQDATPATREDVWVLPMDGDRRPRAILQTPSAELDAALSDDGRWLAYTSDESGRFEVYVQPLTGGGKWQVSTGGGREPAWAHNGRELFYRSGDKMMAIAVTTEPTFRASSSRILFQGSYVLTNTSGRSFDVAPDDQHFLMIQPSPQPSATELEVVMNWFEELKRISPVTHVR